MTAVKGPSMYIYPKEVTVLREEYDKFFKEFFGKKHKKIKAFHMLATMQKHHLVSIIGSQQKIKEKKWIDRHEKLKIFDKLVSEYCEMQKDAIDWIVALTKVSLGDMEGIEYIVDEYDLPSTATKI